MEKVWLKNYPQGIPAEINPDSYQSLVELFESAFKEYSALPAFYNLGVTLNFKKIDFYSRAFAAYLQQELLLKKGDRIAMMLPNVLQYPVALFGALRAGLIVVNINPLYTPPELIHQIKDSGAETLLVFSTCVDTVQSALKSIDLTNIIVTNMGDLFPRPKAFLVDFVLKYVKKKVSRTRIKNSIPFRHTLHRGKKLTLRPVDIAPSDVAFLQYTGGTTGVAKGAMLTHRNIISNVLQAEAWFSPLFEYGKEIIITALPLYHIFSLTANCFFLTKIGGMNVLITNPRDISHMIGEMSKFKFTAITGVNTLFNALLKNSKLEKLDFSAVKLNLGGGMSVHRAVAEKWQRVTGTPISEAYGLTETSPCVSINPPGLKTYNGTVGMPVPSTDVLLFDDNQHVVPIGEPGELAVKGPQVMYGYWRNPAETQKVFTKDGWLLTGDIATIDENGYLRICERKKDMILVSGFNVYPNEVEDVLVRFEGVREAAVIGVPDENSGEAVKAFIIRENPDITAKEIIRYCHKNLTGYKVPKSVVFCEELPKSNVGKILRRALKENNTTIASE